MPHDPPPQLVGVPPAEWGADKDRRLPEHDRPYVRLSRGDAAAERLLLIPSGGGPTPDGRRSRHRRPAARRRPALSILATLLIVLWSLGMVNRTTLGGLIHLLLVIPVAVVLIRVLQGRKERS